MWVTAETGMPPGNPRGAWGWGGGGGVLSIHDKPPTGKRLLWPQGAVGAGQAATRRAQTAPGTESLSRCCSRRNSALPGPEMPSSPAPEFPEEEAEAPRLEVSRAKETSDPGLQVLSSRLPDKAMNLP